MFFAIKICTSSNRELVAYGKKNYAMLQVNHLGTRMGALCHLRNHVRYCTSLLVVKTENIYTSENK